MVGSRRELADASGALLVVGLFRERIVSVERDVVDQLCLVKEGYKNRPLWWSPATIDPNGQRRFAASRFDDNTFALSNV